MLRFSGAGVSDVGRVRPHNEDAAFLGPYVAVVADGVGGAAAGEIASATTAYVVAATALARFGVATPAAVVREAVAAARASLRVGVRTDVEREGMATTMTCLVTDGEHVVLGHVGDSRAYLLRDGLLVQLSRDHTYVQQMLDEGRLSPDRATGHPWRNVVLRSVDAGPTADQLEPDVVALDVAPGDRLLLCSDGLSDLVDTTRIAEVLRLADPQAAAAVLTQSALGAGGRDNITCLVVDVVDGPRLSGDGRLFGALVDLANIVDPAAVRLV